MRALADVMEEAIGRREVLRTARAQAVFRRWEEIVGPHLAAKTTPDRFERGALWVSASGSAWAQELMLQKHVVLDRLNALAGEPLFEDLRTSRPMRKALLAHSEVE